MFVRKRQVDWLVVFFFLKHGFECDLWFHSSIYALVIGQLSWLSFVYATLVSGSHLTLWQIFFTRLTSVSGNFLADLCDVSSTNDDLGVFFLDPTESALISEVNPKRVGKQCSSLLLAENRDKLNNEYELAHFEENVTLYYLKYLYALCESKPFI